MQTLKLLLSYCCREIEIEQMDVVTVFLNGKVISEIYVNQPLGFVKDNKRVYKLNRALYGLKESPRAWYECFDAYMREQEFQKCEYDYCFYYKVDNNESIFILLFVDDILICCKDKEKISKEKVKLSSRFKMKNIGIVNSYVGMEINYDYSDENTITLSQTGYIETLAKRYTLETAKPYETPIETKLKLEPADITNNNVKFRNLLGALLYISSGTRPDIAFSVNYLSRFQNYYNETH